MMRRMTGAASGRLFAPASTRVITYCSDSSRSVRCRSATSRSSAARLASIVACLRAASSMSAWLLRMTHTASTRSSTAISQTSVTHAHWRHARHAVHRLRPQKTRQHVVDDGDAAGEQQHADVAVHGQERQRHEDRVVHLGPAARDVDQQRRHQALADGDLAPRETRSRDGEYAAIRRQRGDHDARARTPCTRATGCPSRPSHGCGERPAARWRSHDQPLAQQQPQEHPVGEVPDLLAILREQPPRRRSLVVEPHGSAEGDAALR